MRVVFLCTANTGRSALADGLLRARLDARGMTDVVVGSAGRLEDGVPPSALVVEVARAYGADLSSHRSTRLTDTLLADADLVLAMAAEHRGDALALLPAARPRTFRLREFVRLARRAGPRRSDESLAAYLHRLDELRNPDPGGADDDVLDPYGHPVEVLWRTAADLDGLVAEVVASCWPGNREESSPHRG